MTISISKLKADRTGMTVGEWTLEYDRNDQANIHVHQPSPLWIALLPHQCVGSIEKEQQINATGIISTHNAAPDLIAIAEAALSWAKAGDEVKLNDQDRFEGGEALGVAHVALRAALAKVSP